MAHLALKICHRCCTKAPLLTFAWSNYGAMCKSCYDLLLSLTNDGKDVTAESMNKFEAELDRLYGKNRYRKIKKGSKPGEWVIP